MMGWRRGDNWLRPRKKAGLGTSLRKLWEKEGKPLTFEEWLVANGYDLPTASDQRLNHAQNRDR